MTRKTILAACCALAMFAAAGRTSAFGEVPLSGEKLCAIAKSVAADNAGAVPEAARAQFVIAVVSELPDEADNNTLLKVTEGIDALTAKQCPADRAKLLSLLKKENLREGLQ